MLIPNKSNTNLIPTPSAESPSGQIRAESMGQRSDGDKATGKCVMPLANTSYINLQQRASALQGNGTNNSPPDDTQSRNGLVDEDELELSDGERLEFIDDDGDEQRARTVNYLKGDEIGTKLKNELTKYKQELKEYNDTTRDLEKKYMKINFELNEMQQKHDHFNGRRSRSPEYEVEVDKESLRSNVSSTTSFESRNSMNRQKDSSNTSFTTVMAAPSSLEDLHRPASKIRESLSAQVNDIYGHNIVNTLAKRHKRRLRSKELENQENDPSSLKNMFNVLKDVINPKQDHKQKYGYERDGTEYKQLYTAIKDLRSEQVQYRSIIRQQQDRITDYHTRCVKAQEIMKTQKYEIDKLHTNNKQLELSIFNDIDSLRLKIDGKLKNVAKLPHLMREEHTKYEKVMRENCLMVEKLHGLQKEASQLKSKIDELGKRKLVTVNRLKIAERDLKIFKNYNSALKAEKRRLSDELSAMKEQLVSLQAAGKRQISRQKEQTEKQRRELHKRIYDLELKLSRSQNSTSGLIQERDSLISELQTQLHTLVHNFEVSQKHIRVLRRHIYSMTSGGPVGGAGTQRSGTSESNGIRISPQVQGSSAARLNNLRTQKPRT